MPTPMHFRLINTEEIIAELVSETNDIYRLRNPYVVVEMPTTVTLAKYVPFSKKDTVSIAKSHVILKTDLHPEMIRYYYNTIVMGKNQAEQAMVGLQQVNDMMEDYIDNGEIPNDLTMQLSDWEPSSNTIH